MVCLISVRWGEGGGGDFDGQDFDDLIKLIISVPNLC